MKSYISAESIQLDALQKRFNYKVAFELRYIHSYLKNHNIAVTEQTRADELTLEQMILCMLNDLNASYKRYNKVPPGTRKALSVMYDLLRCNTNEARFNLIRQPDFLNKLNHAMDEVSSVRSGANVLIAASKFVASVGLFYITAWALLSASLILGVLVGCLSPYVFSMSWLIGSFTFAGIGASIAPIALVTDGINQIRRTWAVNHNDSLDSFNQFQESVRSASQNGFFAPEPVPDEDEEAPPCYEPAPAY